ncbi:helix-turn-helix transcriptional regulator [Solwaraspora sp. WMMD1047]|uniref:helix-turn-helix domain-containing protein n=1 Tax=Solwaraspora sp. WMMD1047 TaxID=3016102 RepID=UPI002418101B|nr:helix-turn-helix transcriptional regulator [Solwaraspora sp. WMMD1047]MDG4830775.1 helix-turn-helix transcriptional regulator [Solwaraspora sp. WMMD1047]
MGDQNEFRHLLRALRMQRGLSQDAVGAAVHMSGSQIGHYETGRSVPPEPVADAIDALLGADGELTRTAKDARGEAVAPWLRPWRENEERAHLLRWFEHSLVPGLLQTEAYARAVIEAGPHTPDQIEEAVQIRMKRQAVTLERSDPVEMTAILGEAALRHGDPTIMKDQLEHLVDIGHRPNVRIRVVPFGAGLHAGLTGAFVIASMPNGTPVVYLDDLVEGKIGIRIREVRHAMIAWEDVCARALPCEASRNLMLRMIDEHEQQAKLAQEHAQR